MTAQPISMTELLRGDLLYEYVTPERVHKTCSMIICRELPAPYVAALLDKCAEYADRWRDNEDPALHALSVTFGLMSVVDRAVEMMVESRRLRHMTKVMYTKRATDHAWFYQCLLKERVAAKEA